MTNLDQWDKNYFYSVDEANLKFTVMDLEIVISFNNVSAMLIFYSFPINVFVKQNWFQTNLICAQRNLDLGKPLPNLHHLKRN